MNILVLGHRGLLGNCVARFLSRNHSVSTINYRFPSDEFIKYIQTYDGQFIINCIGQIPQKTNSFDTNSSLPILLDIISNCKIIHPSSDCESDNTAYGISKKIASEYITNFGKNTKIIQSSIIGLEINSNDSLLSWVLSQTNEINGFSKAMWNGITTLEWAKCAEKIIKNWDSYNTKTVFSTDCISKYDLLCMINEIFQKNLKINYVDSGVNKCLVPDFYLGSIQTQLIELKNFYEL